MNKISNINLGGFPFTIDEDAYQHLDKYLKAIHKHFRKSEGYEEITTDIETRMAELFQDKLEGRPIVTLPDVNNVIAVMGTPEDFGAADPFVEEAPKSSSKKFKFKTGKRLFRDPDRPAIAGVCSGLASYFGIQDPLWMRIAFIILAFTGLFSVVVYLVLWAVVPKAATSSDRLSMRGEPANVENISKIIEEELEHVSKRVTELGEELKAGLDSKKKPSRQPMKEQGRAQRGRSGLLSVRPLPKGFMF